MDAKHKRPHRRVLSADSDHDLQHSREGRRLEVQRLPALTPALPCSEAVRRRVSEGCSSFASRRLPWTPDGRYLGQGKSEGNRQGRSEGRRVWIIDGTSVQPREENSMGLCLY